MSEFLNINIEISKVEKYKKLKSDTPTFLDKYAALIVPPAYHDTLITSLKALLTTYKVDHSHLEYFLYIIGQHLQICEIIFEQRLDAVECSEPLHFLQGYMQQLEDIKKGKSEEAVNKLLKKRYIEVISPDFKSKRPIRIHNTDFIINGVYQQFKKQYPHSLKEVLQPYDDIPPLNILNELVKDNDYILNYATRYFLPEIALDLVDYMNIYMKGDLSRKQYLFIFDFLYLWGIFTIVEEEDTLDYEVTTEFILPYIPPTEKTTYLKKVLHRYKKYIKTNP